MFEASQAEKTRRAESEAASIVLNNKNLKKYSKGSLAYMEDGGEEKAEPEVAGEDESGDTGGDEAADFIAEQADLREQEQYWRDRVLEIRTEWRIAFDSIAELEAGIAGLRRDFYAEDDPFYRDSQIKPAWDSALDELEKAKRDTERLEEELEIAVRDGRRQGALPGWLREGIELEPTPEELGESLEEEGDFHEPSEPVIAPDAEGSPG